jgi:predicted RNase H-like HicB family nuclease
MKYKVLLIKSDEGFAVSCPALPGCWSQGKTRVEALSNIREAIRLWLEVTEEDTLREAAQEHQEVASALVTI